MLASYKVENYNDPDGMLSKDAAGGGNALQKKRFYALKELYERVSVMYVNAEDKIQEHLKYERMLEDKISQLKQSLEPKVEELEEVIRNVYEHYHGQGKNKFFINCSAAVVNFLKGASDG